MSATATIAPQPQAAAPVPAPEVMPSQEPLQEDLYNEGLQRLPIQRKLSVGAVDDPLEDEADAMADKIMRMPEPFDAAVYGAGRNTIQRKCSQCEEEKIQQKTGDGILPEPFTINSYLGGDTNVQRKCSQCDEEEKIQQQPAETAAPVFFDAAAYVSNQTLQRKCAACEEEKIQPKSNSALKPFIQAKGADGGTASDAVTQQINSTRGGGSSMDSPTKTYMESRFGADFSGVKIHTGDDASGMNRELNAQAFTVGSDIYFNSGKYNPSSDSGKHLLAHELTHTVQQGASAMVQRKPGDVLGIYPQATSSELEIDIYELLNAFNSFPGLGNLGRVFTVSGTTGKLYSIKTKDKGFDSALLATYTIRQIDFPEYFLIALPNNKFGYLGIQEVEQADGTKESENVVLGWNNDTPEQKKLGTLVDKELTMSNWFTKETEKTDFFEKAQGFGFAVVIMPAGTGGAAAKADGEEKKPVPPMPSWMKPYKEEMQALIAVTKTAELFSVDIPDKFFVYYSESQSHWRAGASQAIPDSKKTLDVYFDINEKDNKKEKLQEIRDKIRIKQLSEPAVLNKDSKPLDPKLEWAYRLKLELDTLIAKERKSYPSATDLPDKTGLTTPPEDNKTPFLAIWLYVMANDAEGTPSTTLKHGVMSAPLVKGTDPASLLTAVKKATLALRGDSIKAVSEDPKEYQHILEPFPANINGLNTRDDFRTVTGAKLEMYMNLNMSVVAGMDLLNQVFTQYRGILYTWDVYRISEVVPLKDLNEMPKDWKDRRKQLQAWFKNSGQLKNANPALDEGMGIDLAEVLKPAELRQYRNLGFSYGLATSYDAKGTIGMPMTEGEYVIYCRALAEPGDGVFRLPSEAFFTVKLTDGYKVAEEIRDERLTAIEKAKTELDTEKDDKKKKKLQEKIDALKAQEKRTLGQSADYNKVSQKSILDMASKLRSYYAVSGGKEVPEILAAELNNKKITQEDFDKMLDLWMYVETNDTSKKPVDVLVDIISSSKKNIKQLDELNDRIGSFFGDMYEYTTLPAPVVGLVSRVTGQAYPLLLTIGVKEDADGSTHVMLVDLTTHETQEKYTGSSFRKKDAGGLEEAVKEAFDSFGKRCAYGEGFIAYRIPGTSATGRAESAPGPWQRVKQILTVVAAVAGIAALIVGTVFTGGALGVVAGYVGVGAMVIGAGLAAENIYDRSVNHRLHADVELAMDLLNIAGPLLQGAGALAKMSKLTTLKTIISTAEAAGEISAAEKGVITVAALSKLESLIMLEKTLMIVQKGEALTNLGLVGYKTYKDLAMVSEVYADDPAKMRAMQAEIIKNAIISGTFALIALKNEFKLRNQEELDGLVNNLVKEKDYEAAMVKSGIKDTAGNWRDPKLKEYFLGKGKLEAESAGKLKTEEEAPPATAKEKPAAEGAGKHEPDKYEEERQVPLKGHAETPDKQHEVEAYPDGTVGRCSSVTGQKCPLLQMQFNETIVQRPVLKKKLDDLTVEIAGFGANVPKAKMDELAALEQRMRLLETVRNTSMAPKNYKILEIGNYNADVDLPSLASKTMIEYPNGERVWRGADNGIYHEGVIKPSIGRQGLEHDFYTGTETGLATMKGTERAHSFGQGFGWESPFGLLNAPRFVNQKLQNNGIEQYVRSLRDLLPAGQQIVLQTRTMAVSGSRRLKSISYEGFILTASGEKIPAFSYGVEVSWKSSGGSVVDAAPIKFKTSSDAAQQKILTDTQALIPTTKMPEYVVKNIHEDVTVN